MSMIVTVTTNPIARICIVVVVVVNSITKIRIAKLQVAAHFGYLCACINEKSGHKREQWPITKAGRLAVQLQW